MMGQQLMGKLPFQEVSLISHSTQLWFQLRKLQSSKFEEKQEKLLMFCRCTCMPWSEMLMEGRCQSPLVML